MVTRVLKEPKATKFNKNIDKPSVICLRANPRAPSFDFFLPLAFAEKGTGFPPVPFKSSCQISSYSFGNTLYVVPFGIIRGVLRPFTIAWKICARLVKFAFAGKSAGHPPELSE